MKRYVWDRMWARKYCPYISSAFMRSFLKRAGLNLAKNKLFVPEGNLHAIYFEKREISRIIQNYTKLILKKNIFVYAKTYENVFRDFLSWSVKNTKQDFKKLTNGQLVKVLKTLDKRLVDFSEYQYYAFLIMEGLGKEIERMFENEPYLLEAVITPYKDTQITKARLDLLKLISKKHTDQQLKDYVKKYAWLPVYDFVDSPLSIAEVKKQIRSIKDPKLEIEIFRKHNKLGLREYQKLISKEKNLLRKKKIEAVHYFSYLKEMRDDYRRHAYYLWQPFWKEYSKRLGLSMLQAHYLICNELVEALLKKKDFKAVIADRQKGYAHWFKEGHLTVYGSSRAFKIAEMALGKETGSVVSGTCANKGKVKGKVCIVFHRSEFNKLKTGDILVTVMTHPEFLPIMKKAEAIVTDEGGIMCHAAIVSRELGIPCIIGTRKATRVLKDDDLVEVDANKGVVKILKKA